MMTHLKRLTTALICLFFLTVFVSCDDEGPFIELPTSIQAYLDTNYPDAEIEESEQGTLCDGTAVYEVEIEENDDEELDLVFNATEEVLLFTESEIKVNELPAAVTSSIAANYAAYSPQEADLMAMADGSTQYEVELKNGSSKLEVVFMSDGTVVCEGVDDEG